MGRCRKDRIPPTFVSVEIEEVRTISLKEIKNRNIYLTVQDWPQAPVTTFDEAPQVVEEQKCRYARGYFGFSLDTLEQDPVLNRQVNVSRKVYFRSERIADKTSMEYVHAKQLSALLAKQILQELKLEKQRVTPN